MCSLIILTAIGLGTWNKAESPRQRGIYSLKGLEQALEANESDKIFKSLRLPQPAANDPSTSRWLQEVLRPEISSAGICALAAEARFGPLKEIFPDEANRWAKQVGADAADCVAFRMERNGLRAEVVLIRDGDNYLIIRCNNVSQMSAPNQS